MLARQCELQNLIRLKAMKRSTTTTTTTTKLEALEDNFKRVYQQLEVGKRMVKQGKKARGNLLCKSPVEWHNLRKGPLLKHSSCLSRTLASNLRRKKSLV